MRLLLPVGNVLANKISITNEITPLQPESSSSLMKVTFIPNLLL